MLPEILHFFVIHENHYIIVYEKSMTQKILNAAVLFEGRAYTQTAVMCDGWRCVSI